MTDERLARRALSSAPVRVGIVGCGDIAARSYLPVLARISPRVDLAVLCDSDPSRAERLATVARSTWPAVTVAAKLENCVGEAGLDGLINLTPPSAHYAISRAALRGGVNVFCEKPLAVSLSEATDLIERAERRKLLLQCAPASVATQRFAWLKALVSSGAIGEPTLVTAQYANLGPAGWTAYTGDPRGYYETGPVLDQGVYALHLMTGLIGPAVRVQAFAQTALPMRIWHEPGGALVHFRVSAPDQVLMNLEFAGALGQLVSSYAVCASRGPGMEIHGTDGSLSLNDLESADGAAEISGPRESPEGTSWRRIRPARQPRRLAHDVIETGPEHFVSCLRGECEPLLGAAHARHVLEIALAAAQSSAADATVSLQTTFETPAILA